MHEMEQADKILQFALTICTLQEMKILTPWLKHAYH